MFIYTGFIDIVYVTGQTGFSTRLLQVAAYGRSGLKRRDVPKACAIRVGYSYEYR